MPIRVRNPFRSDHDGRSIFARPLVTALALFLLLSMLSIVPGSVRAVTPTIEVDDDALSTWYDGTHVHTITEAIAAASTGYDILVHPGTYAESVTVSKQVNISSAGGAAVTTVSSAASRAVSFTASYANFTGFTVTGGANTGIYIDLNYVRIKECVVTGCRLGIDIDGQHEIIENCTVTGYQTNGIESYARSYIGIFNTTVQNFPVAEVYHGISIMGGSDILIRNCTSLDNTDYGITITDSENIVLEGNRAQGNYVGICVFGCEDAMLRNNTMTGNDLDLRVFGTTQAQLSLNIDASNQVSNGPVRYYVGQPGVAVDPNAGFLALVDCDGVSVSDRSFSHNAQGVMVAYSDDVTLTNIDIEACEYGVYFVYSSRLRMEGVAINGSESFGIRGMYGEEPFFGNCTVLDTGTTHNDDGAYLYQMPNATFYRCNISDSSGYGIYLSEGYGAVVMESDFWNDVDGVGIYLNRANDSIVRDNTIYGCSMGVDIQSSSRCIVERNRALYNNLGSSRIGIGILDGSNDCEVRNNTVIGHTYGLWIRETSGCQVTGNDVEQNGWYAIWVRTSSGAYVTDNTFESSSNTYYSVTLASDVSGCTVVNNRIIGPRCAQDQGSGNTWNTAKTPGTNIVGGPNLGGNYYSDYTGSDSDLDGIGDTPYPINGGIATDQLPLVQNTVPGPPRNLVATPGNTQVSLQWLAPADDGGNPITSYKLYRGTSSGSLSLWATLGVVLTYTDTGLTNGQTYYYGVTASNAVGEGAMSNIAPATPSAPIIIPIVTITSPANNSYNQGSVQLNWTGSDAGSGIAYFEVQLDSQAWINKSMVLTHTYSSLSEGSHQLKVRAWNNEGRSRTAWILVTTDLTPGITVTGKVTTANGDPVAGAIVTAGSHSAATDSNGNFQMVLDPGAYTFTATSGGKTSSVQYTVSEESHYVAIALPGDGGNMDWTWIIIFVIVILGALLFIFFLFWKRRKKDEEEEEKKAK